MAEKRAGQNLVGLVVRIIAEVIYNNLWLIVKKLFQILTGVLNSRDGNARHPAPYAGITWVRPSTGTAAAPSPGDCVAGEGVQATIAIAKSLFL